MRAGEHVGFIALDPHPGPLAAQGELSARGRHVVGPPAADEVLVACRREIRWEGVHAPFLPSKPGTQVDRYARTFPQVRRAFDTCPRKSPNGALTLDDLARQLDT